VDLKQFHGAWPALVTPATDDGGVAVSMLAQLTEYLIGKGVGGLYLCGSTGEGVFLSVPERRQVAETVVKQVAGRIPVIVHVGTVATRHAVMLAQHAQEAGADGVASILPPFRRNPEETLTHYEAIAASVPGLPFYPYLFGGETDAVSLMQELLLRIPNIAGAKYTGPNLYELRAIIELGDQGWTIFSGMDEQCAFAGMVGSPANIGTTLNLMPGVYREIRVSLDAGDFGRARDLQLQVNRVTRVLHHYGVFGALFEGLRVLGLDCGEPRLPRAPLSVEQRAQFHAALAAAGFSDLASM
jgi:N-acetylneuraminate lyase